MAIITTETALAEFIQDSGRLARGEIQFPETYGMLIDGNSFESLYWAIRECEGTELHIAAGYDPADGTFAYRELLGDNWAEWIDGIVPCGDWAHPTTRQQILDCLAYEMGIIR